MKCVNITNKEIKQIRNKMSRFDDDWIAAVDTSFADDVWLAQRKMFYELLEKLEKTEEDATNGDVISALFPNAHITDGDNFVSFWYTEDEDGRYVNFRKPWWDAPYKRSGEE